jgi:hypothetical protein
MMQSISLNVSKANLVIIEKEDGAFCNAIHYAGGYFITVSHVLHTTAPIKVISYSQRAPPLLLDPCRYCISTIGEVPEKYPDWAMFKLGRQCDYGNNAPFTEIEEKESAFVGTVTPLTNQMQFRKISPPTFHHVILCFYENGAFRSISVQNVVLCDRGSYSILKYESSEEIPFGSSGGYLSEGNYFLGMTYCRSGPFIGYAIYLDSIRECNDIATQVFGNFHTQYAYSSLRDTLRSNAEFYPKIEITINTAKASNDDILKEYSLAIYSDTSGLYGIPYQRKLVDRFQFTVKQRKINNLKPEEIDELFRSGKTSESDLNIDQLGSIEFYRACNPPNRKPKDMITKFSKPLDSQSVGAVSHGDIIFCLVPALITNVDFLGLVKCYADQANNRFSIHLNILFNYDADKFDSKDLSAKWNSYQDASAECKMKYQDAKSLKISWWVCSWESKKLMLGEIRQHLWILSQDPIQAALDGRKNGLALLHTGDADVVDMKDCLGHMHQYFLDHPVNNLLDTVVCLTGGYSLCPDDKEDDRMKKRIQFASEMDLLFRGVLSGNNYPSEQNTMFRLSPHVWRWLHWHGKTNENENLLKTLKAQRACGPDGYRFIADCFVVTSNKRSGSSYISPSTADLIQFPQSGGRIEKLFEAGYGKTISKRRHAFEAECVKISNCIGADYNSDQQFEIFAGLCRILGISSTPAREKGLPQHTAELMEDIEAFTKNNTNDAVYNDGSDNDGQIWVEIENREIRELLQRTAVNEDDESNFLLSGISAKHEGIEKSRK